MLTGMFRTESETVGSNGLLCQFVVHIDPPARCSNHMCSLKAKKVLLVKIPYLVWFSSCVPQGACVGVRVVT